MEKIRTRILLDCVYRKPHHIEEVVVSYLGRLASYAHGRITTLVAKTVDCGSLVDKHSRIGLSLPSCAASISYASLCKEQCKYLGIKRLQLIIS